MKKTRMLKKNYDFKNILSKGNYYSGKYIEAFIKKNNFIYNMLGIAISVKVAKAVKRNYLKRIIRENYRLIENQIKPGYSVIFMWKKKANIENATFDNIKIDMINILEKAHVFEEKK